MKYIEKEKWITQKKQFALFFIPILTILMVLTNGYHNLFYTSYNIQSSSGFIFNTPSYGQFWFIHTIYSYLCIMIGFILIIRHIIRTPKDRTEASLILIGTVLPYIANFLYILGLKPYGFLDITPIGFLGTGILLSFGVFTTRIFKSPNIIQTTKAKFKDIFIIASVMILVLTSAWGVYQWNTVLDNVQKEAFLIAETASIGINGIVIKDLNAVPSDQSLPAYNSIKERLINIAKLDPNISFTYLYVKREDKLIFMVDSKPIDSKDY
ncbi:MAG TPA: histidine kinase N-terminal 7TM domain-containing protein, partial [Candidatus Dojkabacteria bacterium]|nr:histidine kinase N-terminal 7TM domain-containing protein [Candidatus Dojkabacteria bacterium]